MPRLFASKKDYAFFSDITKELIKDIAGQTIRYFHVSEQLTNISVYDEGHQKVFDPPVLIDVLADNPKNETHSDRFGIEDDFTLELFIHWRDLVDRGITVYVGDFFQYGDNFYEIHQVNTIKTMLGQVEHKDGIRIWAKKARDGQFKEDLEAPTDVADADGTQDEFVQQRGLEINRLGPTGDSRDLQKNGLLEPPMTGAKEVSKRGDTGTGPSFYGED